MDPTVDAVRAMLDIHVNAWMASCLGIGVLALIVALVVQARVGRRPDGPESVRAAGRAIHGSTGVLLRVQASCAGTIAIYGSLVLAFVFSRSGDAWTNALSYACGCVSSGVAAGVATRAASAGAARTVQSAATRGFGAALRSAYLSGAAGALFTAGMSTAALAGLYLGTGDARLMASFALGASATALAFRTGGGVFAKSASTGCAQAIRADHAIPDDSASNAGVVADGAGDAATAAGGMSADLAESCACAVIATMTLGAGVPAALAATGRTELRAAVDTLAAGEATLALYPVALLAAGVVAALVAALFVKTENERKAGAMLHRSGMVGALLTTVGATALTFWLGLARPEITQALTGAAREGDDPLRYNGPAGVLWATLAGLVLGIALGRVSEWRTSDARASARRLAENGAAGPAASVLDGLALGLASSAAPALLMAATVLVAHYMAGAYGIAVAAAGLVAAFAVPLAVHAFGGVAWNAGRIAAIARVGPETRGRAEALETAAARTRVLGASLSTGAAALAVFALLAAFRDAHDRLHPSTPLVLDLAGTDVLAGLLAGAAVPLVHVSWVLRAVSRVSRTIADEIVAHFRAPRGPADDVAAPDHARFVAAAARRSLHAALPAALLAIAAPVVCGLSPLGARGLAGLVAGATISSVTLSFALVNSGAAWHNAKRYVASGVFGGKGSPAYKASVVGHGVGDPLKDAAGPALGTLVKLMAAVSLVLLPFFAA